MVDIPIGNKGLLTIGNGKAVYSQRVILPAPKSYQIARDAQGNCIGVSKGVELIVRPGLSNNSAFKRRSIKRGAVQGETCWLVGELDGVRVYIAEGGPKVKLVMTREDLNP